MEGFSVGLHGMISVIIPTYNRLAILGEALESLARQSYRKFEVIVVNDAGEDVLPVVRLYNDLDIKVINQTHNQKHVHARNRGISEASGQYIMLLDDDDLLLPEHMERMLAGIECCDFLYSDAEIFRYKSVSGQRIPTSRHLFSYRYDPQLLRIFNTFLSTGCLYRAELHQRLGMFDTKMYHYWDWDWILRVSAECKVKRLPVASVLYAFAEEGGHQSGNHELMKPHLDLLCKKHGLGELPTKNFFVLLDEPGIAEYKADSRVIWDGCPFTSRYAKEQNADR
jgi:glycosyltransferase involved in cell wall biosynthesis